AICRASVRAATNPGSALRSECPRGRSRLDLQCPLSRGYGAGRPVRRPRGLATTLNGGRRRAIAARTTRQAMSDTGGRSAPRALRERLVQTSVRFRDTPAGPRATRVTALGMLAAFTLLGHAPARAQTA